MQVSHIRPSVRQTRYVAAVMSALSELVHATNAELLVVVRKKYPEVSATTIHRVTTRLEERGRIACAPKPTDGAARYDITPIPHHHFICINCSAICDVANTNEATQVIEQLKELSGQCAIAGTLTMRGVCKKCHIDNKVILV